METEKLQKKIEFLEKNINSGKSSEELDKEFETWYEEDFKKRQYEEYVEDIKKSVQDESEITLTFSKEYYDEMCYEETGSLEISRVCTLKAFVNKMVLRRIRKGGTGSTQISLDLERGMLRCYINYKGEISGSLESYGDILISTKGEYSKRIGGHEEFTLFCLRR